MGGAKGLGHLPVEILVDIVKLAVVERYAIVDPARMAITGCGSQHVHVRVPHLSPGFSEQNAHRPDSRHDSAEAMALNAAAAIKAAQRQMTEDAVGIVHQSGTITFSILLLNRHFYEIGINVLYKHNRFLFTNVDALQCFVRHYPQSARRLQHVILPLVPQVQTGFVQALEEQQLVKQGQINQLSGIWENKLLQPPDFVPSARGVGLAHDENSCDGGAAADAQLFNAHVLTGLKTLLIHFINWQQLIFLDVSLLLSAQLPNAPTEVQGSIRSHHKPAYVELGLLPIKEVRGADLLDWARRMAASGWRAADVDITGLELLSDQEKVKAIQRAFLVSPDCIEKDAGVG